MPRREEILSNMRQALQTQDPEWDISPGTPEFKILEAVAQQLETISRDGLLSTYHFDIDKKAGIELDLFLSLWGFYRIKSQRSTGQVTFRRSTASTSNFSIPIGTQVFVPSSSNIPAIYFSTISNAFLSTGSTEVTVPVEAAIGGLSGNIGAYRVTGFATNLPGITEVFNESPMSGGTNSESDEAFRERFRRTFMRNISGTENQIAAVAYQENAFVNRVNSISAVERYNEQIQLVYPINATTTTPYEVTKSSGTFTAGSSLTLSEVDSGNLPDGTFYVIACNSSDEPQKVHKVQRGSNYTFTFVPPLGSNIKKIKVVFPTTAQDSKFVYPEGGEVVGVNTGSDNEIIAKAGANQDYQMLTFNNDSSKVAGSGCVLPVFYFTPSGVVRLGGPGTIVDISYEYTPKSSRNDPTANKVNKLDIFVDGIDPQNVQEQFTMAQSSNNTFGTASLKFGEFFREDGFTNPLSGHFFTPLGRSPITELGKEISVQRFINSNFPEDLKYNLPNATTYYLNEDYWLVRKHFDDIATLDKDEFIGSQRAVEGIEWKAPSSLVRLQDGSSALTYIYPRRGASSSVADMSAPFALSVNETGNLDGYYGYVVTWEVDGQESLPSNVETILAEGNKISVQFDVRFSEYPGVYIDGDAENKTVYRKFYRSKAAASESEAEQGPFYLVNIIRNNDRWAWWVDNKSDDDLSSLQPPKIPPPHGAPLNVSYSYNSLIERLDAQMESVRLIGQDVLSHQANLVPVKFNLAVVLLPNISVVTATNAIRSEIAAFLNRKQFSGDLQLADLFTSIESVTEVDNVRLLTEEESGNEVKTLNLTNNAGFLSGDTITLTVDGYSTSSLFANEDSYVIREALEALPVFDEGDTYAAPLTNTFSGTENTLVVQGNQNAQNIQYLVNNNNFPVYLQITQFGSNNQSKDEIVKVSSAVTLSSQSNTFSAAVTHKSRSGNVATLTTAFLHGFRVDDTITISVTGDSSFGTTATVTAVSPYTVSYVNNGPTVSNTACTGTISATISQNNIRFTVERAQLGSKKAEYTSNVTDAATAAWIHLIGDVAVTKQTSTTNSIVTGVTYTFTFLPNPRTGLNNWGNRSITDIDGNSRISVVTAGDFSSSELLIKSKGSGYGLELLANNYQTIQQRYENDIYFVSSELPVFGGLDLSIRARNTF